MKRFICIIILALLLCAPAMAEDAALTYCWFSFGGYLPSQTYEVTMEEGIYRLERDDGASCQLEEEAFNNLLSIIDNNDLYAWDGFNESEQYVLDGEGFSLDISFSDGRHIHAHGDNRFPEGYDAVKNEMVKLFDAILDGDFSGTYIYTAGGFGGDFTITLETDGSYTFYEGPLSSYIGGGHWYAERSYIYLVEENGFDLQFYFTGEKDALIYEGGYSDPFPYVKVPDGGRFVKANLSVHE